MGSQFCQFVHLCQHGRQLCDPPLDVPDFLRILCFRQQEAQFPETGPEGNGGFFVAFAMPTAGLASTFADTYGGDTDSAVAFTLSTTMLSILSIPLLYGILSIII